VTVKYPYMREDLLNTIEALSDADYQQKAWVEHEYPPGIVYDDFDEAVHVLFDNMRLLEAPELSIDTIVRNREELDAVLQVTFAIDHVLNKLGTELSDAEYIADPDWAKVIETAAKALAILEKP
jgi:hypothetical protein